MHCTLITYFIKKESSLSIQYDKAQSLKSELFRYVQYFACYLFNFANLPCVMDDCCHPCRIKS